MLIRSVRPPLVAPLARPISEDGSGLGWDGGVGGGPLSLDLTNPSLGTFTRSTEGSYLTGAPTDGSSAFLAWAAINARRIENRGDGLGAMLLMEGSRTNYLLQSRQMSNAAWTAGTATETDNANAGVDGATLADRENAASLQFGNYQTSRGQVAFSTMSAWARAVSGTAAYQILISQGATPVAAKALSIGTTYQRNSVGGNCTPGTASGVSLDARDQSAIGGQVATAQDAYLDLCQLETGYFPSSPIRTTVAAVTRGADVLSYAVGQYPDSFRTRGYVVTFAPDFSSAECVAGNFAAGLVHPSSVGLNDAVYLSLSGPNAIVAVRQGATADFLVVTYARGTSCTIKVEPSANKVTLSGFATGNGVFSMHGAWTIASAPFYIGGTADGANPFFGRFAPSLVGL